MPGMAMRSPASAGPGGAAQNAADARDEGGLQRHGGDPGDPRDLGAEKLRQLKFDPGKMRCKME